MSVHSVNRGDVVLVGVAGAIPVFHAGAACRSDLQKVFDALTEKIGIHFVVVPGLEDVKVVAGKEEIHGNG